MLLADPTPFCECMDVQAVASGRMILSKSVTIFSPIILLWRRIVVKIIQSRRTSGLSPRGLWIFSSVTFLGSSGFRFRLQYARTESVLLASMSCGRGLVMPRLPHPDAMVLTPASSPMTIHLYPRSSKTISFLTLLLTTSQTQKP